MTNSAGAVQNGLVLRLSVPTSGEMSNLGPELATRLADSRAEGCDLAVIVTQPGSKSHQNAQRSGFHLLYTRAVLVTSPSG